MTVLLYIQKAAEMNVFNKIWSKSFYLNFKFYTQIIDDNVQQYFSKTTVISTILHDFFLLFDYGWGFLPVVHLEVWLNVFISIIQYILYFLALINFFPTKDYVLSMCHILFQPFMIQEEDSVAQK